MVNKTDKIISLEQHINVQLLSQRDPSEVRKLIQIYSAKVYNTVISYLGNKEEAEEVTQDVFMAVMDASQSFKGKSKLSTWIYRVAVNKSLDFIKYKRRQKRFGNMVPISIDDDEGHYSEPADYHNPGIALESQEQMNALYAAINRLPDSQKTALILTKLEGRSQKEVSEIMETTQKAVESLVGRAKSNLRKLLEEAYENV